MSNFTQTQVQSLRAAIAEGALEVQYENKRIKYRSLSEMLQLLRLMESDLGISQSGGTFVVESHFDKGF